MKQRPSLVSLLPQLLKIYWSDSSHKEQRYKETIFHTLQETGGVYIKFLQFLCVTGKFMDGWSGPKEFEVFNQVRLESISLDRYIKDRDAFSKIEETPFASGSFAQLYRGRLKSGEEVAIKILRPSISATLKMDLLKLKRIVRWMSYFLPRGMIDYRSAFEEFSRTCLLETNYEREMANMEYFGNLYQDQPYIVIPKVYRQFSNRFVIVQQYIEGPTLADLMMQVTPYESIESLVYDQTGSNIWKQLAIVGGEALRTAITADYVYGDPHPGNIILLSDNRIALIDFGIIASKPISQEAFYLWMKSYHDILAGGTDYERLLQMTCLCYCPDLTNALKNCSDQQDLIQVMAQVLSKQATDSCNLNPAAKNYNESGHLLTVFTDFVDSPSISLLDLDMRNFQLLKAIQEFLGSVTTLDKQAGSARFSLIMMGAMEYALEFCERNGVVHDLPNTSKYSLNESYELFLDALATLADRDEVLFQNVCERMFL